jgi:hypothetical protein
MCRKASRLRRARFALCKGSKCSEEREHVLQRSRRWLQGKQGELRFRRSHQLTSIKVRDTLSSADERT